MVFQATTVRKEKSGQVSLENRKWPASLTEILSCSRPKPCNRERKMNNWHWPDESEACRSCLGGMRRVETGRASRGGGGTGDACGGWREGKLASAEEPAPVLHTSLLPLAEGVWVPLGSWNGRNNQSVVNRILVIEWFLRTYYRTQSNLMVPQIFE